MTRCIDDVVGDLTAIVETSRREASPLGIFPSMYRTVTTTVGEGIDRGFFDDPARVERMVVVFADRYLDAYAAMRAEREPSRSWDLAFTFARRRRGSVVQHLLLGMNAHINLDLGVATSEISTADDLASLRSDFLRVNDILFALVDDLQGGLGSVSPWMARLDRLGLGLDEACMRSGIAMARSQAWEFGEKLVVAPGDARSELIHDRDGDTRMMGQLLCNRLSAIHLANRVVAMRETSDVAAVIDAVGGARIDLDEVLSGS